MRWFIVDRGGFVRAYVAAPEWMTRADVLAQVVLAEDSDALTLEEMLSSTETYAWLKRWQAGDDSGLEVADAALRVLNEAEDAPED